MEKYQSIQYLRALAALMVVFHHARNPFKGLYDPLANFGAGQAGVDIFFVISGFVMYSAARKENVVDFVRRRLIRVVPLYWIATLATIVVEGRSMRPTGAFSITKDVVESLLFIPHFSPAHPGEIWPYLVPGWTLNFEIFFYAVFAVGLATKTLVPVLTGTLVMLVGAGLLVKPLGQAAWLTYTNPLLLEFLAGVFVAKWSDHAQSWRWALLFPLGALAIALSALISGPRALLWGVPSVMMVIGAVAIERIQKLPNWKLFGVLGDASYSIYLFQVIALGRVGSIVHKAPLNGPAQLLAMIGFGLATAVIFGLIFHYTVERPITRYLSGGRRPRRAVASAPNP